MRNANAVPLTLTQSEHRTRRVVNLHVLLMLAALLFACQSQATTLTGILPVNAPDVVITGSSVTVTVGPVTASDGTRVGLVMVSKHGPRVYRSTFEQGWAEFIIPGEDTLQPSGYLAFIAASGDARGETGMLLQPTHEPTQSSSYVQDA